MARKLWAVCDEDGILMIISLHADADKGDEIPDQGEWDSFPPSCPVCGGSLSYDEDPTSIEDDVNWHRKAAGRRTITNLLEFMSQGKLMSGLEAACEHYGIDPANHGVSFVDQTTGS